MTNILIVEDDPLTMDCLTDLLEAEDFQVTGASDGEIAQTIVTQKKFDVIVCDLLLPKISGYEFLSYLRNHKKTADIPFIVLTGKNKTADINLGREMGVDDYLIKPFINQDLIKSINTQLEKKQFLEKCYQAENQNSATTITEDTSSSNLANLDYLDLDRDLESNLAYQSILIESQYKLLYKYINERVESSAKNSLPTSSIAICCLLLDSGEKITTNSTKPSADIIKMAAQRLLGSIGHKANIRCLSNGDLAIILPYIKNLYQALRIIRRGQESLSKPLMIGSKIIKLKSHLGISFCSDRDKDIPVLLRHAQKLARKAIKNRDDCYQVYSPHSFQTLTFRSLGLVEELQNIWSKNQLNANYQPQIDLLTGKVIGYEALLRWQHPQRGNIPPEQFIPIAEDVGLIESIETKFMFDECKRLKQLHKKGFRQLKLAINISTSQFHRDCFIPIVKEILTKVQLRPQFLTIELTESTLFKDKKKSINHLTELKSLGVGVTLDNLERDSSSLSYLKQFPFTILKVNISNLNSLLKTTDSQAILKYITREAKRFDLKLIIESVETKQQLIFLRQHHFTVAQGNYLAPALTIEEFEYLLSGKSEWLNILFSFPPI